MSLNSFDGQNYDRIAAQKQFNADLDAKVEKLLDDLPDIIRPLLEAAADELDANVADVLRIGDRVTGDSLDRRAILQRLIFKVSNKLGHGCQWLK
ncbi:hypothetical protein HVV73_13440 [Escherichia coli]|nr:hypothetical protein [Escherichia coli]QMQ19011.1 hypothetical protein HVV77_13440 [Escherichia coli]QMQ27674.1 hypothetical protein HVV73_13440 [Escherichia coli]